MSSIPIISAVAAEAISTRGLPLRAQRRLVAMQIVRRRQVVAERRIARAERKERQAAKAMRREQRRLTAHGSDMDPQAYDRVMFHV